MASQISFLTVPRCNNISWKYPFLPQPFVHYTLQSICSLLSGNIPFLIRAGKTIILCQEQQLCKQSTSFSELLGPPKWDFPASLITISSKISLSVPASASYLFPPQNWKDSPLASGHDPTKPAGNTWIFCLPLLLGFIQSFVTSCN